MLIGIIVSGLVEEYSHNLCNGVEYMASRDDVKCVIIPGKYINMNYERDFKNKYGYCFNSLFSFGSLKCFDGLIIEMASTMMYADEKAREAFAEQFKDIPHVFVSYDKGDSSSVTIDNKAGLTEALEYTYRNGARKYAMIGGPENNNDALERKNCFVEFLNRHNLPNEKTNYQEGSFFLDCSREAERLVRDNLDADVFVCANDILAKRMYTACQKYGIMPGSDVSVIGFDDSDFCVTAYPTISSVRTDVSEVGKKSYELLMDIINGSKATHQKVPSKFILRDSILHREAVKNTTKNYEAEFRSILKSNTHIEDHPEIYAEGKRFFKIFIKLDSATESTIKDVILSIDNMIDEMFFSKSMDYIDWELLVNLVDRKYKANLETYHDSAIIELLTISYVKFLQKVMKYTQTIDEQRGHLNMEATYQMECFFRDTMHYARSTESNYSRFLENMDFLGIENAYLYLYETPVSYMQGEVFEVPEYLNLKAVLKSGIAFNISTDEQRINREDIYTTSILDWFDLSKLIMLPLYSENYLYGIILSDIKPEGYKHIEMFTNQLSAAIRMLQLRMENKQILDEYEETVRTLKENNISLDTMSKTDTLTGLNNRRGFYQQIDELKEKLDDRNEFLLLGYADMNDLKVVNDRFGHENGDFALKTIGKTLSDFAERYQGVAARMGGDEFAFAITIPKCSEAEDYRNELHKMFEICNQRYIKPYWIRVSVGYCILDENCKMSVDDALAKADEMLYVEKLNKSSVIKFA